MPSNNFAGILSSQLLALAGSQKKDPTTSVPFPVITQASTGSHDLSSPSTYTHSLEVVKVGPTLLKALLIAMEQLIFLCHVHHPKERDVN